MVRISRIAAAFIVAGSVTACATPTVAPSGPGATGKTALGDVFTSATGMTLYTYDKDASGKSNCNYVCAEIWPPVTAPDAATPSGRFTVVTRDNGSKQWAVDGKPLYGYVMDRKPGDTKGDGVDGVWHVAKP